jgi:hypothetical protein
MMKRSVIFALMISLRLRSEPIIVHFADCLAIEQRRDRLQARAFGLDEQLPDDETLDARGSQ